MTRVSAKARKRDAGSAHSYTSTDPKTVGFVQPQKHGSGIAVARQGTDVVPLICGSLQMRIPTEAVSNSINRKAEQRLAQVRQTLEAILKERDAP